jgi:hypothetical protein
MREFKISGKSCKLSTGTFVYIEDKELGDIFNKQLGKEFNGTVDIEINIKEVDTSLKILCNAEQETKEGTEE